MSQRNNMHSPSDGEDVSPGARPRHVGCLAAVLFRFAPPVVLALAAVFFLAATVTTLAAIGGWLSRFLPLTAFQLAALMTAIGLAAGVLFMLQDIRDLLREALSEEDDEDDALEDEPTPKPYLHPVLPFDRDELLKASGLCPCGSGLRYEDCCGKGTRPHGERP